MGAHDGTPLMGPHRACCGRAPMGPEPPAAEAGEAEAEEEMAEAAEADAAGEAAGEAEVQEGVHESTGTRAGAQNAHSRHAGRRVTPATPPQPNVRARLPTLHTFAVVHVARRPPTQTPSLDPGLTATSVKGSVGRVSSFSVVALPPRKPLRLIRA